MRSMDVTSRTISSRNSVVNVGSKTLRSTGGIIFPPNAVGRLKVRSTFLKRMRLPTESKMMGSQLCIANLVTLGRILQRVGSCSGWACPSLRTLRKPLYSHKASRRNLETRRMFLRLSWPSSAAWARMEAATISGRLYHVAV